MRALQFVARFGLQIEEDTQKIIKEMSTKLKNSQRKNL